MIHRVSFPILITMCWCCACGDDPNEPDADETAVGFVTAAAGALHTCGLSATGSVYCWGDNTHGQLGNEAYNSSYTPVQVAGSLAFQAITSGGSNHTCGLTEGGEAYCWGQNAFGQLGNGTTLSATVPVRAAEELIFTHLDAGTFHTCGVTASGRAYCWGANAADGIDGYALGAPTTEYCDSPFGTYKGTSWPCSLSPVAVSGALSFRSISAGQWATCGITVAGTAYCWGWNSLYQLGTGAEDDAKEPTQVAGGRQYSDLDLGCVHGCGLVGETAYCWGGRAYNRGQLGTGTFEPSIAPSLVAGDLHFTAVAVSNANDIYSLTCALATGGAAYCWGTNRYGGLGTETTISATCDELDFPCANTPVPVAGGRSYQSITVGQEFACGVTISGDAYCWGRNEAGQLGDGTNLDAATPVQVVMPW